MWCVRVSLDGLGNEEGSSRSQPADGHRLPGTPHGLGRHSSAWAADIVDAAFSLEFKELCDGPQEDESEAGDSIAPFPGVIFPGQHIARSYAGYFTSRTIVA